MKKFKLVQMYDQFTGKVLKQKYLPKTLICDYCGKEIHEDDDGARHVSFTINEESGSEESYYYIDFISEKEIDDDDKFQFWNNQDKYHYCVDFRGSKSSSCSGKVMQYASENDIQMLNEAMQECRRTVVNELLEKLEPAELGFFPW